MSKRIFHFLLLLLFFLPMGANADNYEKLWANVKLAYEGDLPKTAIEHVRVVRNKASREGNQPELLRALCTEFVLAHEISPDSDAVSKDLILKYMEAEKNSVNKILYKFALGKLTSDTHLMIEALDHPEKLAAARATDYVPAFVIGKDSRWYNDDLLSTLTISLVHNYDYNPETRKAKREAYRRMREIYERQGNEVALLITDFYDMEHDITDTNYDTGEMIERICRMMPKIKQHGFAASHMKEWVDREECPSVNMQWKTESNMFYPEKIVKLAVSSKNLKQFTLQLYRITDAKNYCIDTDKSAKEALKNKKNAKLERTTTFKLDNAPAYEMHHAEFEYKLPRAGIYVVQMMVDGKPTDASWLCVTHVKALFFNASSAKEKESRMVLVDAMTGKPFTERVSAKIAPCENPWYHPNIKNLKWEELPHSKDGTFLFNKKMEHIAVVFAHDGDEFHPFVDVSFNRHGYVSTDENHENFLQLYTDRAIYRPGQKVQFGGLAYFRNGDIYTVHAGMTGTVTLINTKREDVATINVTTDEMGQFNGEFVLPENVIPGRFGLVFRSKTNNDLRRTEYFSVEEYKRPTFRVELQAPDCKDVLNKKQWEVGDTMQLNGFVKAYSGIAIPEAQVKWSIDHTAWGWWRSSEKNESLETPYASSGETVSDEQGHFALPLFFYEQGRYTMKVEVTASNGETAQASYSLYVGSPTPQPTEEEEQHPIFSSKHDKDKNETFITLDRTTLGEGPLYVFYDIVSSLGGLIKSERLVMNTEDVTKLFHLTWKEEHGEAVKAYVAFYKNGKFYNYEEELQKPTPDKRLLMSWSSFRNLLQPGEQETWTLSVKNPDGTPADARVMARLYDASLDAFATNPWNIVCRFDRRAPFVHNYDSHYYVAGLNYDMTIRSRKNFDFTKWESSMFSYSSSMKERVFYALEAPLHTSMRKEMKVMGNAIEDLVDSSAETEAAATGNNEEESEAVNFKVRENFDETAFFMPCLKTDDTGCVAISFTLPESLTQWNFTALAHDKDMKHAILNDTIFAQKKIMAEIAAPRFLREGDSADIPVTVRNLTEQELTTDVIILITDAESGKTIRSEKQKITVSSQEIATMSIVVAAKKDFNIRVVAKAQDFSDGEERFVPVFEAREHIQASIPFSTTTKGNITVDISKLQLQQLMRKDKNCQPVLTVEYCANPIWNVIRVVPQLIEGEAYSANDWAVKLYTIEVADFLARKLVKTESSEIVKDMLNAKDIPALRYSALDHLRDYQNSDGGFSWFRGFYSSLWITTDVSILLARQQKMTGSATAKHILDKAVSFMEKEVGQQVEEMKKRKAPYLSESHLRYLYIRQLLQLKPGEKETYLLNLAAKEKKDLTMYGKGIVAQILQGNHDKDAILALESLIEHTVVSPEMGRYFDTERALGGWSSYKIPTQTMAVETLGSMHALKAKGFSGDAEKIQNEMKLWLLQSKRTQKWESNRASADATYALLHGNTDANAESKLYQELSPEDYSKRVLSASETDKAIKTHSYNIIKENDGLSWGAVFADYSLPVEMVETNGSGFTLTRKWEVLRNGKWQSIEEGQKKSQTPTNTVMVGEHVRQVITLRAERDFDFVQIEASRAACLEPLHPLSGTTWQGGTFCYRMVRDSRNDYYFEHLSKGTHTFTEELIVDHSGTFTTGTARVECSFAPEFRGIAPSTLIFATSKLTK